MGLVCKTFLSRFFHINVNRIRF